MQGSKHGLTWEAFLAFSSKNSKTKEISVMITGSWAKSLAQEFQNMKWACYPLNSDINWKLSKSVESGRNFWLYMNHQGSP